MINEFYNKNIFLIFLKKFGFKSRIFDFFPKILVYFRFFFIFGVNSDIKWTTTAINGYKIFNVIF